VVNRQTFLPSMVTLLVGTLSAACGDGGEPPAAIREVRSGFDPAVDGLAFPNFAGFVSTAVVDAEAARRMFGDAVCTSSASESCVLKQRVESWLSSANAATQGGLCEGFAALSPMAWRGDIDLGALDVPTAAKLKRDGGKQVDRELAYWFATQYLDAVTEGTRLVTAKELLVALSKELDKGRAGETFRIGLLRLANGRTGGGHALTPYALEHVGGDAWQVLVYDSNFPLVGRRLDVNLAKNTWSYVASTNPDEPEGMYEGGPGNRNPLYLTPNSTRLGTHPCSVCGDGSEGQTVTFNGALSVTVTDAQGNSAGEGPDGLRSDIEGMRVSPVFSALYGDDAPYVFHGVTSQNLTVSAVSKEGLDLADDSMSIVAAGPSGIATVHGHGFGGTHVLNVLEDGSATYVTDTSNGGPLTITTLTQEGREVSASVEIDPASAKEGVSLALAISPETGEVSVKTDAGGAVDLRLEVTVQKGTEQTTNVVLLDDVVPSTLMVETDRLQHGGEIAVSVDEGSDGIVDTEQKVAVCTDSAACPPFDDDGDMVPPADDNCPKAFNPGQDDLDGDHIGDACDPDRDGDGIPAGEDCEDANASRNGYCRCDPGRYDDDADRATPCAACAAGQYCAGRDAAPVACAAGSEDHDRDPATACRVCPPGAFCAGGDVALAASRSASRVPAPHAATACEACAAGRNCPGGSAQAEVCPAGSWDDDASASTACVLCAVGEYCPEASVEKHACAAGSADHDRDPATACEPCAAGGYCEGGGAMYAACAAGEEDADLDARTPCIRCAMGTFCGGGNAPRVACVPGSVDHDGDATSACVACAVGTYCEGGASPLIACDAGSVDADADAATPCQPCLAGGYCAGGAMPLTICAPGSVDDDASAATACTACPAGGYCAGGTAAYRLCQPGTADADGDAATPCAACSAGAFCEGGVAASADCPPGTRDHDADPSTACQHCASGSYCPGGTSPALACALGSADHDGDAATPCQDCAAGGYCPGGSAQFAACAAGTWDGDDSAATACIDCSEGTYCAGGAARQITCARGQSDGDYNPATPCMICPVGGYCVGGIDPWVACNPGQYDHDTSAATPCQTCPEGSFCSGNSASAISCGGAGTFCPPGSAAALGCPAGFFCAGGASPPAQCAPGTVDDDQSAATPCVTCVAGQYCAGGAAPAEACTGPTFDPDRNPATPCVQVVASLFTAGDADDDLPVGNGTYMDVATRGERVIALSTFGGTFEVGTTSFTAARFGGVVYSLDANNNLEWSTGFGAAGSGDFMPRRIAVDPITGNVAVVGAGFGGHAQINNTDMGAQNGNCSPFVTLLDGATGGVLWNHLFPSTFCGALEGIAFDGGTLLVVGSYQVSIDVGGISLVGNGPAYEGMLIALDMPSGAVVTAQRITSGAGAEQPQAIAVLPGGDRVVTGWFELGDATLAGTTLAAGGIADAFIARLTPAGDLVHATAIAGANAERIFDVHAIGAAGDYVVGGTYDGSTTIGSTTLSGSNSGTILARFAADGTSLWATGLNGGGGTGYGTRRFAVSPSEELMVIGNLGGGGSIRFGSTPIPSAPTSLRVVRVPGATGGPAAFLIPSMSVGITSASGIALTANGQPVAIGHYNGDGTVGALPINTLGSNDHVVLRFGH
jgi:hypothetical protein